MGEGGRIDIENGELEGRGSQGNAAETIDARYRAKVDANGCLTIPPSLIHKFGLAPGAEVEIVPGAAGIVIRPNIHRLARVYVEPTARCNLTCRMCIRNSWKEPIGDMDRALFDRLASQLRQFPLLESVMFGGFGEPSAHPDILHMIKATKELAIRVELTTNGTNLDETMIAGFMDAGLDRLWISLDGVTEGSFDEIRQGASFDNVMANL
jgi:sulfatase maturation enzyme AslB (radical SAM superfamily)